MQKFRKRPVVVEVYAQQFDPNQPPHQWPLFVEWEPEYLDQDGSRYGGFYKLSLPGGFDFIHPGNWVVQENGRRFVMTNKAFMDTYERVE